MELFEGHAGRPKGMGSGLTVEVVVDPAEHVVAVFPIQTSGRDIHRDFETTAMPAIVE